MADNERVKWGVIGAGGIADRKTLPGLLQAENCALEAVMDVRGVEAIAKCHGAPKHTDKIEDILNDDAIQAVYIATPVFLHAGQIRQAAEAGKHILCEKPLTLTAAEAREAVAFCKAKGVRLQEGYMMKFHGAHKLVRDCIERGRLGTVAYMRAQLACWFPPIDGAWRQDPARGGGGALMDMATHLFDLLEYFCGPVASVSALTGHQVHDYASEDGSVTMLEFKNGAHATVDCYFNIPDEASRTRLEVYGSKGAILSEGTIGQGDGGRLEGLFKTEDAGYDATQNKDVAAGFQPLEYEKINMYAAECAYLADCILHDKPVAINGGEHAVHLAELVEAAYESARTGRRVVLPD